MSGSVAGPSRSKYPEDSGSDIEPDPLPQYMEEQLAAFAVAKATITHNREWLEEFLVSTPLHFSVAEVNQAEAEGSVTMEPPDEIPETLLNFRLADLEELNARKVKFFRDVDLARIFKQDPDPHFVFDKNHNLAANRLQWILAQSEAREFWQEISGQSLIMECFDPDDGDSSPLTYYAVMLGETLDKKGSGYSTQLYGPQVQQLKPADCLLYLIGRIIADGFDPDVKLPDTVSNPQALFSTLLMSHLRVGPLLLILNGIGALEKDKDSVDEWVKICRGFVTLTRNQMPKTWPMKLLIVNTERSEAIEQIKEEFADIPILQCPTGAQFPMMSLDGNAASSSGSKPKKEKKNKKGKNKA